MNIVLSNLQHAYTIHVPKPQFAAELLRLAKDAGAERKAPASYDTIAIKPGFNNIDDGLLSRLKNTRVFKGLLDSGKVFINNRDEERRYNDEVKHILHSNKEYQEHRKKLEFERENQQHKQTIHDLKNTVDELKSQMVNLLNTKNRRAANKTIAAVDVDDNTSNN